VRRGDHNHPASIAEHFPHSGGGAREGAFLEIQNLSTSAPADLIEKKWEHIEKDTRFGQNSEITCPKKICSPKFGRPLTFCGLSTFLISGKSGI
jgi:hypothetical protein